MVDYFEELLKILGRWAPLGTQEFPSGARRIGHVPHLAPQAYLHEVYAPLSDADMDRVEERLGRYLPRPLREFYRKSNGLRLFAGKLDIYGNRFSYDRSDVITQAEQPFDIVVPNLDVDRPGVPDFAVVFASYEDESLFYLGNREQVYRCPNTDGSRTLNRWDSFQDWLLSEARRLASLYDDQGRQIDPDQPTEPPVEKIVEP